jgi:2-isopropylmalate synthase
LRDEAQGRARRFFRLESWRTITAQLSDGSLENEATVKLWAKGERVIATGEGNGPVIALDRALRGGLEQTFPELARMQLVDYKVRILEGRKGSQSTTRVLVTTSDGGTEWSTVGVADNVIAASWQALEDAYTYGLLRVGLQPSD